MSTRSSLNTFCQSSFVMSILQKETFYRFNLSTTSSLQRTLGQRISEKQLQQHLSTDQQQLQDSNLAQTTFQQLNLEQHIYQEEILNNELATNLENKKSLEEDLSFQTFFFENLGFQTNFSASGELVEKNFYKKQLVHSSFTQTGEGACKEQLPAAGFPAASANKQLLRSSLSRQSVAKAASLQELSPAYSKRATGQKELLHRGFKKHSLQTECLQEHLCREQLAEKNFYNTSFYNSNFPKETFNKTAFQPAACQKRASEQQLLRQQL